MNALETGLEVWVPKISNQAHPQRRRRASRKPQHASRRAAVCSSCRTSPARKLEIRGVRLTGDELNEMGPIDYLLVEWPGRQPTGEAMPHLIDLVDRGLIRILDLAFIAKGEDGSVAALEISDLGDEVEAFAAFEGASSGLLSDEDVGEAGAALEAGTSAALLVFENRWAAPFAAAVRRSGGQLVASGRIPIQAVLAALDEAEATS